MAEQGGRPEGGGTGQRVLAATSMSAVRQSPQGRPGCNTNPNPVESYQRVARDPDLFRQTLENVHALEGKTLQVPVLGGKELDLHKLFVEVTIRGGIHKVVEDKKLDEVFAAFPETGDSDSLLQFYKSLLHPYEQLFFLGPEPGSSSRIDSDQGVAGPELPPTEDPLVSTQQRESDNFSATLTRSFVRPVPDLYSNAISCNFRPTALLPRSPPEMVPVQWLDIPMQPPREAQVVPFHSSSSYREPAPNQYQNATRWNPPSTVSQPSSSARRIPLGSVFQQGQPHVEAPVVASQQRELNYILALQSNLLERQYQVQYNNAIQGNSTFAVSQPRASTRRFTVQGGIGRGQPSADARVLSSQQRGLNNCFAPSPNSFENLFLGQCTNPLGQFSPSAGTILVQDLVTPSASSAEAHVSGFQQRVQNRSDTWLNSSAGILGAQYTLAMPRSSPIAHEPRLTTRRGPPQYSRGGRSVPSAAHAQNSHANSVVAHEPGLTMRMGPAQYSRGRWAIPSAAHARSSHANPVVVHREMEPKFPSPGDQVTARQQREFTDLLRAAGVIEQEIDEAEKNNTTTRDPGPWRHRRPSSNIFFGEQFAQQDHVYEQKAKAENEMENRRQAEICSHVAISEEVGDNFGGCDSIGDNAANEDTDQEDSTGEVEYYLEALHKLMQGARKGPR